LLGEVLTSITLPTDEKPVRAALQADVAHDAEVPDRVTFL
jgi:hypothetical protein